MPTGPGRQARDEVVELSEVVVGAFRGNVDGLPVSDLARRRSDRNNGGFGVLDTSERKGLHRGSRWQCPAGRWWGRPKGAGRGWLIRVEGCPVRRPGSKAPQALEQCTVLARQRGDDVDKFQNGRCFGLVTHGYPTS